VTGDKRPRKPNANNTPQCPTTGHQAFKNDTRAQKMATRVNEQRKRGATELYPFKCPHCRWWHLAPRPRTSPSVLQSQTSRYAPPP